MDVMGTMLEFKNYMKARGYAESTIAGYSTYLDQFMHYLDINNITDLKKVRHQVILDYQERIASEPVAMESKALKIRAVKRLFEYLTDTHKLLINPTEGIVETCRKKRKIGPVLTVDEVRKLLNQPTLSIGSHLRDRAIMEVFYSTGIRLDELLNLNVDDIDLEEKVLYIRKAKGRKQRVVPVGKSGRGYCKEYMEKIRPSFTRKNPEEERLFLLHTGRPMTPASVRGVLWKYRVKAGIKKSASPRTLRRTCATHLLQSGADIRYIQKLLGHKRVSTTQVYTKVMPVDIKKTHTNTHPGVLKPKTPGNRGNKP